jgi:hypothetical protein
MKAAEFDRKFDDGADITAHLDLSKAKRVTQQHKRVNVSLLCKNMFILRS